MNSEKLAAMSEEILAAVRQYPSPDEITLAYILDGVLTRVDQIAREIPAPSHQAFQLFSLVVAARNEMARLQSQSSQRP